MTDVTNFTTEGEAREYVEENPEEAVKLTDNIGEVYLFHDGGFQVNVVWEDGDVTEGPILGDDHRLDADHDVEGTVPRSEVPEVTARA